MAAGSSVPVVPYSTCIARRAFKPKAGDIAPWLNLVRNVFPNEADHIIIWLAHRLQRPHEKVNHALVLGGKPGIGKDTILEPIKQAIGPWNFADVSPKQVLGRFNGFLKSVILRVNEARDLGEFDRYAFHDHMKAYIAAPPDVNHIDEKNIKEYYVFNLCGVIITSNHKTDGIYLPADDRRHMVAWSNLTSDAFAADYWRKLYSWYGNGGDQHVAAYLAALDITGFDPKAPPPKTQAFWEIANANRAPEDSELADVLDELEQPDVLTLDQVANRAALVQPAFAEWLRDRRNRRSIPHRFEDCGRGRLESERRRGALEDQRHPAHDLRQGDVDHPRPPRCRIQAGRSAIGGITSMQRKFQICVGCGYLTDKRGGAPLLWPHGQQRRERRDGQKHSPSCYRCTTILLRSSPRVTANPVRSRPCRP